MLYGYIRVSTIEQDTARQRADILEAANAAGLQVAKWVEEKASGVAKERAVHTLLDKLEEGDVIAVTELSRIGRSLREINDMVSQCRNRKASIWTVNNGQRLGADMDIAAEALLFALGIGAQIERDLIIERTKSGLRAAQAKGVRLGRIPGTSKLETGQTKSRSSSRKGFPKPPLLEFLAFLARLWSSGSGGMRHEGSVQLFGLNPLVSRQSRMLRLWGY
jgi:DNA invertase Pin-like site-specific DNA recombinase